MKKLKIVLPAAIAALGVAISMAPAHATPAFAKKEKKSCTTCHVSVKTKELNETGKCYKENQKLDGCPMPEKK